MSYQLKVSLAFYFYGGFILVFCLIATWRVPSERLTAVSVDLQCGSSAHLLPSLLSLQQVPREPRWTRASVSRSSSWQEPRPCLPVVNGGQRAPPTRRLRPGGCCGELSQPPRASPSPRPPCALRVSPPHPRGGGGLLLQETGRGEAARTHVPQKLHPPPRPAPAGAGAAWLLAAARLVLLRCSAQAGCGRSCLLVPLAHSAGLRGPARSSPRSRRPHPGPAILGPCFSLLLLRACFAPSTQHPGSPWPEGRPNTSSHSPTSQILLPPDVQPASLLVDNICLFFITR